METSVAAPLAVAGVATLACVVGAFFDLRATLAAWLAGFVFWLALPLGALALGLIRDLTGGDWLRPLRPRLDAAVALLPLLALAFLPILAGIGALYPWSGSAGADLPNRLWLNAPFFVVRSVVYFAGWLGFGILWLRRPDGAGEQLRGALGLVFLGFSVNFAAIDWTMSLDPHWSSSVYGMIFGAALLLDGLAFLLLPAAGGSTEPGALRPLGGLLLALVLAAAYLEFMQYLIVWESNLEREIAWYLRREDGAWGGIAVAAIFLHFLLPLLALFSGRVRAGGGALALVCLMLLAGWALRCWWLVLPDIPGAGFPWQAPAALIAIGGFVVALYRHRRAGGRLPLLPAGRRAEAGYG